MSNTCMPTLSIRTKFMNLVDTPMKIKRIDDNPLVLNLLFKIIISSSPINFRITERFIWSLILEPVKLVEIHVS